MSNEAARVVVALDASSASPTVLGWAAEEARVRDVTLHLISACPPNLPPPTFGYLAPPSEVFDAALDRAATEELAHATETVRQLRPDVRVTNELVTGLIARVLLEAVTPRDLLVLGRHGHGGLHDLVLGSVGRQVAAHAVCPVAVICEPSHEVVGQEAGRVVVGIDGSKANVAAVAYAFEFAERRGLALTAIHSWDVPHFDAVGLATPIVPSDLDEVENAELRAMSEALAGWREQHPGVAVRQRIVHSSAVVALAENSEGAAALVLGTRGHGGFAGLMLGSVTQSMLHHTPCPLIIVRTPA